MSNTSASNRILSISIAIVYIYFSCLYVIRCPNFRHTGQQYYSTNLTTVNASLPNIGKTTVTGNKQLPLAFLSRPRVIASKNIKSLTTPIINFPKYSPFNNLRRLASIPTQSAICKFFPPDLSALIGTWRI